MKKNILALFLAASMGVAALNVPVMAEEDDPVNFIIDGLSIVDTGTVVNRDGYNLLGMREVFELLGADVKWNSVKRTITATKDNKTVVLDVDKNEGYADGKTVTLPTPCVNVDGHVYVPVRFVSDAFGCDLKWYSESRTIDIYTGDHKYIMLDVTPDITEDTRILSYDEALKMAVDKSSDLKALEDSVDYLKKMRTDLGDLVWSLDQQQHIINSNLFNLSQQTNEILAAQLELQTNVENVIVAARNIKNVEIQQSMVSVNEEMVKDGVELALKSYVNNIRSTQTQIDLLEASIEVGEENIKNLELKNKLGYESDYNLSTAKTTQENNKNNLEVLKLNLANEKQALKTLLGIDASEDVYVESETSFNKLQGVDLEKYVDSKREKDPSIKTLKNNLTLAEYKERTNAAYSSENKIGVRNEVNSAQRALADGKDNLEKGIRSAYNNLKQLEENNEMLLRSVEQSKSDYNSVVASYKSGMATAYQVRQAKLGILSAEKAVEDNAMQYDLLAFTFDRPYLLSAIGK